jgi:hypothetical protein
MVIAEPYLAQNELAARFGYTQSWISIIMTSDAFRAKLAERREDLVDPILKVTLEDRFRAMTQRSLEILQEKLSAPASVVPDGLVLKAMELGAKSLGLGGNAPPQALPPDHLDRLAERLLTLQRGISGRVIEGEVTDC